MRYALIVASAENAAAPNSAGTSRPPAQYAPESRSISAVSGIVHRHNTASPVFSKRVKPRLTIGRHNNSTSTSDIMQKNSAPMAGGGCQGPARAATSSNVGRTTATTANAPPSVTKTAAVLIVLYAGISLTMPAASPGWCGGRRGGACCIMRHDVIKGAPAARCTSHHNSHPITSSL